MSFEIRVAGVMEQFALGNESRSPDGLTPRQVLQKSLKLLMLQLSANIVF